VTSIKELFAKKKSLKHIVFKTYFPVSFFPPFSFPFRQPLEQMHTKYKKFHIEINNTLIDGGWVGERFL